MKKLNTEELKTLVIAVLLMVIGILFCCSLAMGINGLSVIIGIILMVLGILFIVNSIIGKKGIFTMQGVMGVVITALGIMFIANKLASLIFVYIPWFLLVLGAVTILDAFLGKYSRNESDNINFIIKLVVGIVALVLGLCLKLIDGFAEYASIILGILMIIYSIYIIFIVFTKGKTESA